MDMGVVSGDATTDFKAFYAKRHWRRPMDTKYNISPCRVCS